MRKLGIGMKDHSPSLQPKASGIPTLPRWRGALIACSLACLLIYAAKDAPLPPPLRPLFGVGAAANRAACEAPFDLKLEIHPGGGRERAWQPLDAAAERCRTSNATAVAAPAKLALFLTVGPGDTVREVCRLAES